MNAESQVPGAGQLVTPLRLLLEHGDQGRRREGRVATAPGDAKAAGGRWHGGIFCCAHPALARGSAEAKVRADCLRIVPKLEELQDHLAHVLLDQDGLADLLGGLGKRFAHQVTSILLDFCHDELARRAVCVVGLREHCVANHHRNDKLFEVPIWGQSPDHRGGVSGHWR